MVGEASVDSPRSARSRRGDDGMETNDAGLGDDVSLGKMQ